MNLMYAAFNEKKIWILNLRHCQIVQVLRDKRFFVIDLERCRRLVIQWSKQKDIENFSTRSSPEDSNLKPSDIAASKSFNMLPICC